MNFDHLKSNLSIKVYYEDTDAGGIIYHSKYLNFAERGRSEFLGERNLQQSKVYNKYKIRFVVRSLEVSYKKTASLDDVIDLFTSVKFLNKAKIVFNQIFYKKKNIICKIEAVVCCIDKNEKVTKIPSDLYYKLIN
tara:strand:- start:89 stop:496 length:408 start_codon:yes stop_codon:yes gene_type:complete